MRLYQSSEQQRMGNVGAREGGLLNIGVWSPSQLLQSQLLQGNAALLKQWPVGGDHQ